MQSFVVLMIRADGGMAPIHNHMPVVLEESRFDEWTGPKAAEASLRSMLRTAPEEWLIAERALPPVNSVKNDAPELLAGLLD